MPIKRKPIAILDSNHATKLMQGVQAAKKKKTPTITVTPLCTLFCERLAVNGLQREGVVIALKSLVSEKKGMYRSIDITRRAIQLFMPEYELTADETYYANKAVHRALRKLLDDELLILKFGVISDPKKQRYTIMPKIKLGKLLGLLDKNELLQLKKLLENVDESNVEYFKPFASDFVTRKPS